MRRSFLRECHAVMDAIYDSGNEDPPLPTRLRVWIHLLLCPSCAEKSRNWRLVGEIMRTDFLPPSPELEDAVMERLAKEDGVSEGIEDIAAPAAFSLRGWAVIGFFLLLSLSTSFFGENFGEIAAAEGLSFLLPVGITVGMAVTCYGALFIGSHLKELSTRFRLR